MMSLYSKATSYGIHVVFELGLPQLSITIDFFVSFLIFLFPRCSTFRAWNIFTSLSVAPTSTL